MGMELWEDDMGEEFPFGKYKGQPLEVVLQDEAYVEWLTSQDWFRDRFPSLHTIIINQQEPQETPEHNRLQALFLDEGFRRRFCERIAYCPEDQVYDSVLFEHHGVDVVMDFRCGTNLFGEYRERIGVAIEVKPSMGDDYPNVLRQIGRYKLKLSHHHHRRSYRYEIFDGARWALLLDQWTGTGVTQEQMVEIFKLSGVRVVFLKDLMSRPF